METKEISRIRPEIAPVDSANTDLFADELPATPITLPHLCNEEKAEDDELLSHLSSAPWCGSKVPLPEGQTVTGSEP